MTRIEELTASSYSNITWHEGLSREERAKYLGQQGFTLWLTGLSASGKSTIATALEQHLLHNGVTAYRLDGRSSIDCLCCDLKIKGRRFIYPPCKI